MSDRTFDEVLDEYLDGHISMAEADARLKHAPLTAGQAELWNKLRRLDDQLAARAHDASQLPWLSLRVGTHIEARERARRWLRDNPGGLLPRARLNLQSLAAISSPRLWTLLGAILAGSATGYCLGIRIPLNACQMDVAGYGISILAVSAAVLCGALAALAVYWPHLKEYYT